jgi:hypothetical protein
MITCKDLKNNKYTEEELERYVDDFTEEHWEYISCYQILSEPFIEKFKDLVDWGFISYSQTLSEPFINRFKDLVDWLWISKYQKLSENFLLNNLEFINTDCLDQNKNISKELIEKIKFMKEIQS